MVRAPAAARLPAVPRPRPRLGADQRHGNGRELHRESSALDADHGGAVRHRAGRARRAGGSSPDDEPGRMCSRRRTDRYPVRVRFEPVSDEIALPLFEPDPTATTSPPPAPPRPIAPAIRPRDAERLERRAILSGVGQSQIGRRLLRTDLDLTCEAALRAIADAGLTPSDIDGLACYPGPMGAGAPGFAGPATPDVQDALGLQLGWHGSGGEGPAQLAPVMLAALAVAAGLCRHALVYRTVTEATAAASTGRLGIGAGARTVSGFAQWVIPFRSE